MEPFRHELFTSQPRLLREHAVDTVWMRHAETVAPDIHVILTRAHFIDPMLLQSLDDLSDVELKLEFNQILERPAAFGEFYQFKLLVQSAAHSGNKRRRILLKSFDDHVLLEPVVLPET